MELWEGDPVESEEKKDRGERTEEGGVVPILRTALLKIQRGVEFIV